MICTVIENQLFMHVVCDDVMDKIIDAAKKRFGGVVPFAIQRFGHDYVFTPIREEEDIEALKKIIEGVQNDN